MKIVKIDYKNPDPQVIKKVAEVINRGKVAIVPGDVAYTIVADAFNAEAIKKVYKMKRREKNKAGALSVDGHIRYAIDPRGFAKPDYYIEENIGDPLDVLGCWNHPFMKKMRNLGFVPKECRACKYLQKCRGGSRFAAKLVYGRWDAKDPLMF